ncbi:hypothetical protein K3495_g11384 [Podosphaera aphanis]|nr:hypothetical protein K3495_g11384 [Podosphaera aphanis]
MEGDGATYNSIESMQNHAGAMISKIEAIFESMLDCLIEEKHEMVIRLKRRPKVRYGPHGTNAQPGKVREVCFPSRNSKEAWMFSEILDSSYSALSDSCDLAALLRILELSHEALVTGIVTTKRDIYYHDPKLFVKQSVVDRLVDDIAYTFGVGRDALNVVAAAKGLVAGFFTVTQKCSTVIDYSLAPEGILVPNCQRSQDISIRDAHWVLVIEKEATFQTLATSSYWKYSAAGTGIILTVAKGYPDIRTRRFLNFLSSQYPEIPIYALVDFDPDGIGIMSTYKHGSLNLSHEKNITVSSMRWLGIKNHDILTGDAVPQKLLSLSPRDRRYAMKMLERAEFQVENGDSDCKTQLQIMLLLNLKAEIQILGSARSLSHWLDLKLLKFIYPEEANKKHTDDSNL